MAYTLGNPNQGQSINRQFYNFDIGFKPQTAVGSDGKEVIGKNGPVLTCVKMWDAEVKQSFPRQAQFSGYLERVELKEQPDKNGGPSSNYLKVWLGDDETVCVASIPIGSTTEDGNTAVGFSAAKLVGLLNRAASEHAGRMVKIDPAGIAAGTVINGVTMEKTIPSIRVSVLTAPETWARVTTPLYADGSDKLPETPKVLSSNGKEIKDAQGKPMVDKDAFNAAASETIAQFSGRVNAEVDHHAQAEGHDEQEDFAIPTN